MTTHMAPMAEEVYVRQPYEQTNTSGIAITPAHPTNTVVLHQDMAYDRASMEAAELAAFEKGRMQGEMEAIRRAEATAPLKVMAPANAVVINNAAVIDHPDVIEINRLTWLQRLAGAIGELSLLGTIALTVAWAERWREGFAWDNGQDNGEHRMLNAAMLSFAIGLFFNANAITNYRFLPLRMNPHFNRGWYLFLQTCAGAAYAVAFAAVIMTFPPADETTFWRVDNWVFAFALAVWASHYIYSSIRTVLDHVWPVDYEDWVEVNNNLDNTHNRMRFHHKGAMSLDGKMVANGQDDRRTIYTPAPRSIHHGRNIPAANANVGAQVPVAPGNAPRWSEIPRTHAENFFLLARAKWANVAFWSMGAAFLMLISSTEVLQAAGRGSWSSGAGVNEPTVTDRLGYDSTEAHVVGALGLLTLAGLIMMSYAAAPPRTTFVKNAAAISNDASRRPSISHNAETIV